MAKRGGTVSMFVGNGMSSGLVMASTSLQPRSGPWSRGPNVGTPQQYAQGQGYAQPGYGQGYPQQGVYAQPQPQRPPQPVKPAPAQTPTNGDTPPLCPAHNKPMRPGKNGGWFCFLVRCR